MQQSPASPAATLAISARFCGPAESGNGGYTCGRLAAALAPGAVEVTLRQPPPLDRELAIMRSPGGLVLVDGASTIAEACPVSFQLDPPPCPGLAAATDAAGRYQGFEQHAFPTCFVCGPQREPGDGLRVFAGEVAGEVAGEGLVASPWRPDAELADADGAVRPEFAWAALDCPGAWAWLAGLTRPLVLGRMAAVIDRPVIAGRLHVVGAWRLGHEGRKYYSGSTIWRADGTVCARAQATWIEIDPARFGKAG